MATIITIMATIVTIMATSQMTGSFQALLLETEEQCRCRLEEEKVENDKWEIRTGKRQDEIRRYEKEDAKYRQKYSCLSLRNDRTRNVSRKQMNGRMKPDTLKRWYRSKSRCTSILLQNWVYYYVNWVNKLLEYTKFKNQWHLKCLM